MARSRNIKPGFFKNEKLASCDPITRLFFAGLWTVADKQGRFEVRLDKLKADIFPHEQVKLEPCLAQLWDKEFISLYEDGDLHYGQVRNWKRHQSPHHKEIDSIIPEGKEEKLFKNQDDMQAWLKHGSSMNQSRFKKIASSPLIPDSLNLIPDAPLEQPPAAVFDWEKSFDEFWAMWPKRGDSKKPAKGKYKTKCKSQAKADEILAGLKKQLRQFRERENQHIPAATTWLNQERWENEPEPLVGAVSGMKW